MLVSCAAVQLERRSQVELLTALAEKNSIATNGSRACGTSEVEEVHDDEKKGDAV